MSGLYVILALPVVLFLVVAVLVWRMAPEPDVQVAFAKTYLKAYRGTKDRQESLLAALAVVRQRPPFSEVSDDDARFLADSFGRLHQPHLVLGQVLHTADHRRSAGALRDRASVQVLVEGAEKQGA